MLPAGNDGINAKIEQIRTNLQESCKTLFGCTRSCKITFHLAKSCILTRLTFVWQYLTNIFFQESCKNLQDSLLVCSRLGGFDFFDITGKYGIILGRINWILVSLKHLTRWSFEGKFCVNFS